MRAAEVTAALMAEPGVQDVRGLTLLRWPAPVERGDGARGWAGRPDPFGENIPVDSASIPAYVELLDALRIVTR